MDDRFPDNARPDTDEQAEARMRHALSLMRGPQGAGVAAASRRPAPASTDRPGAASRRHRFVQDGEVPVVTVQRPRRDPPQPLVPVSTPAGGSTELAAERNARLDAERRLADTQVSMRSFQTRLGDAELARDRAEAELQELRATVAALHAERAQSAVSSRRADPARSTADDADIDAKRRRRADALAGEPEPEPVKWWV